MENAACFFFNHLFDISSGSGTKEVKSGPL